MSASREKKRRQELYQAGEPKGKKQPTETKTPGWKKALYWCIGVVFVIAFVAVLLFNSSFFARHSTAMTVGEHKLSPAMVDMYYSNIIWTSTTPTATTPATSLIPPSP